MMEQPQISHNSTAAEIWYYSTIHHSQFSIDRFLHEHYYQYGAKFSIYHILWRENSSNIVRSCSTLFSIVKLFFLALICYYSSSRRDIELVPFAKCVPFKYLSFDIWKLAVIHLVQKLCNFEIDLIFQEFNYCLGTLFLRRNVPQKNSLQHNFEPITS